MFICLPSLVVAIRLSGSTCEKQQYDELSDDTNDMDVVEVDLPPGLLADSAAPHLPPWPALTDWGGGGTISMTTIREIGRCCTPRIITGYRPYYNIIIRYTKLLRTASREKKKDRNIRVGTAACTLVKL